MTISELKKIKVFRYFDKICQIPRTSGNTQAIANYLKNTLQELQAKETKITSCGNVIAFFEASKGFEKIPMIALQCHMDMVGSKTVDSNHNFNVDPISWKISGDWLQANDTTLGADNGIGMAIILEFLSNPKNLHGPIQVIFTVDEETTLLGATELRSDEIKANYLINLDFEESNTLCLGCARGYDLFFKKAINLIPLKKDQILLEITIKNLHGGHSGSDIHLKLINGIKEIYYCLSELMQNCQINLVETSGGIANNVIPTSYSVIIATSNNDVKFIKKFIESQNLVLKKIYANYEQSLEFFCKYFNDLKKEIIDDHNSKEIINAINGLFNGLNVFNFDFNIPESSSNIGKITQFNKLIEIAILTRSPYKEILNRFKSMMLSNLEKYGFQADLKEAKDGWIPDLKNNKLAQQYIDFFKKKYHKNIIIKATAGELEVAEILSKKAIDAISLGMDIVNPHSPKEKVSIKTTIQCYEDLSSFLKIVK